MQYFVYIVECSDGSFYCGYTSDLEKRLIEHNNGVNGAKYTRSRRPVKLAYSEEFETQPEAMRREHEIKSYTRGKKQTLIISTIPSNLN